MTSEAERPGLWTRLVAHLDGEVPATTLEAYRRAGAGVYEVLSEVELRRAAMGPEDGHPGTADRASRTLELCAWNAFALQLLGDELLAGVYRAKPSTVGFVPPVTAEQAHAFYSQVEGWLSRARQALSNPTYRLDVEVPAELPGWSETEHCPREHLEALFAAARRLYQRAAIALDDAARCEPSGRGQDLAPLRELLASVETAIDYADRLHRGDVDDQVHERIEASVRDAIETAYLFGQLAAMPELLDRRQGKPPPGRLRRKLALPGQPGFDPWCLTDPVVRSLRERDARFRRAIELLWRHDPHPEVTLAIQGQINHALARGAVAYATDRHGHPVGRHFCCPWAPIYVARRRVTIAGRHLKTLEQFTLDVSAEPLASGGKFRRRILRGPFEDAATVDF
jgi:hypothetical protein